MGEPCLDDDRSIQYAQCADGQIERAPEPFVLSGRFLVCNGERSVVRTEAQGIANLITTPEHKIWARHGRTAHPRAVAMKSTPDWMRADETVGSYLNLPLPPMETNELTADEWWIVGRWL